jgi:hypothetical protein
MWLFSGSNNSGIDPHSLGAKTNANCFKIGMNKKYLSLRHEEDSFSHNYKTNFLSTCMSLCNSQTLIDGHTCLKVLEVAENALKL